MKTDQCEAITGLGRQCSRHGHVTPRSGGRRLCGTHHRYGAEAYLEISTKSCEVCDAYAATIVDLMARMTQAAASSIVETVRAQGWLSCRRADGSLRR